MSLKMKLVSMISAFVLVIGMLLIGVFAVERVQVDMGGSITFNADDVYARVTGNVTKAQVAPEDLDVTYSATGTTGNPTAWENLNLEFDSYATPIVISITVENLSTERSLTVNLTDALTSSVPNLGKALQRDNGAYTSGTNITLDPKDNGTSTTTFTITLSVTDKNQSLTNAQFDYDLNLYDESVAPKEILEGFIFDDSGNLTSYTGTDSEVTVPSSYSMIGEPTTKSLYFETVDSTEEYMMTLVGITNFKLTTDDGEEYILDDFGDMVFSPDFESKFPCTLEYKDYSNVTFTTGSDYQVEGVVGAFIMNQTIQTVNLPDTIKNIGIYSFTTSTLNNITLPEGLISIGGSAFYGCSSLTSITLPSSLTSIYYGAFWDCEGLTSITLPSSLISIGKGAFKDCSGLTGKLDFSNCTSLTSIGEWAFYGCNDLTSITLPDSLMSIGERAFYQCSGLTSITLPDSLMSIGEYAFYGCSNLQPSTTDDNGVKYLGSEQNPYLVLWDGTGITNSSYTVNPDCKIICPSAFSGCDVLTSITLPEGLKSIGDYAFQDCSGLTTVDLSNCTSLTSIGMHAFRYCSGLTSITLPERLTSIGEYAFSSCSKLTEVIIDSEYVYTNATSRSACGYLFGNSSTTTVKVLTSLDDGTNSYITTNFTKGPTEVINGKNYTVYSK